jgi:hypothetical protein
MKLLFLLFSLKAFSGAGSEVLIRGKVGGSFNDQYVKITDSFGQSYVIPTHYFPKTFVFKQGADFVIEVPDTEVQDLKKNPFKIK